MRTGTACTRTWRTRPGKCSLRCRMRRRGVKLRFFHHGQVAQSVERSPEKAGVGGFVSVPVTPTPNNFVSPLIVTLPIVLPDRKHSLANVTASAGAEAECPAASPGISSGLEIFLGCTVIFAGDQKAGFVLLLRHHAAPSDQRPPRAAFPPCCFSS